MIVLTIWKRSKGDIQSKPLQAFMFVWESSGREFERNDLNQDNKQPCMLHCFYNFKIICAFNFFAKRRPQHNILAIVPHSVLSI